jgi:hypothetical protein
MESNPHHIRVPSDIDIIRLMPGNDISAFEDDMNDP